MSPCATFSEPRGALRPKRLRAKELLDASIARVLAHDAALNALPLRCFDTARAGSRACSKACR